MAIDKLKIEFGGSFQCRLATNPAHGTFGGAKPSFTGTAPNESLNMSNGWTYLYGAEVPFDRIIRLHNPISLRNALMEPWKDTAVTSVMVNNSTGGWKTAPTNVLMNEVVSLGTNTIFDARAPGAYESKEKLVNFKISIGSSAFKAVPKSDPPQLPGAGSMPRNGGWENDYKTNKPSIAAGASLDPLRKKLLNHSQPMSGGVYKPINGYAQFYAYTGSTNNCELKNVTMAASPLTTAIGSTNNFKWEVKLDFYKFDGDTLVGKVKGEVLATRIP